MDQCQLISVNRSFLSVRLISLTVLLLVAPNRPSRLTLLAQPQEVETVSFCDVIGHPERYDGHRVKVTGRYDYLDLFYDDHCTEFPRGKLARVIAGNEESQQTLTRLSKRLSKSRRKNGTGEAELTMIATFLDNKGRDGTVCLQTNCTFTLKLERIIDVRPINDR